MKISYILVAAAFVLGVFWYLNHSKTKSCEDKALAASVEEVTRHDFPDTNERAAAQGEYKKRYIEACMDM